MRIAAFLFVVLLALHSKAGDSSIESLNLPDLKGQIHKFDSIEEPLVLIHFWATWCGPCVKELPELIQLDEERKDLSLLLVSVDTKKKTKAFVDKHEIKASVLHDQYGKALNAWKVEALPTSFLLSKERKIQKKYVGATDWNQTEVQKDLKSE